LKLAVGGFRKQDLFLETHTTADDTVAKGPIVIRAVDFVGGIFGFNGDLLNSVAGNFDNTL
jgi:hypothetical protein